MIEKLSTEIPALSAMIEKLSTEIPSPISDDRKTINRDT
jgi:hypothetical protein